jgi:AcrR family transcriptional regulator
MSRQTQLDDAGLLRLLWNPQRPTAPRPGPKSSLTLDAIVAAGIELADDRGGPALSMRLVADRLGCTPMALYSYVDNKQTLMRLMYDKAHGEFPDRSDGTVHEQVQDWAAALADLYARHYWLSDVSWSRPVLGPNEQAVLEALLRRLQPLDLTSAQYGTIASALFALCRNTGRMIADARHARQVSGLTDEEWWAGQSAALAAVVPGFADRFPLSANTGPPDTGEDMSSERSGDAPGYLERAARTQLAHTVRLLLAGATATGDAEASASAVTR